MFEWVLALLWCKCQRESECQSLEEMSGRRRDRRQDECKLTSKTKCVAQNASERATETPVSRHAKGADGSGKEPAAGNESE